MSDKKYVPVTDVEQLQPGELIRVTEEYENATTTYEGPFKEIRSRLIFIDAGPRSETSAWMDLEQSSGLQNVTIERELKLPTTPGSAILWHNPGDERDHVLVLVKRSETATAAWLHPDLGPMGHSSIAAGYVRTLWEA